MGIHSIRIQNFKSIRDSGEILLKPLNVLIGANGVGKSNFIGFFKFLNRLYEQQLQLYMAQNGRADNFLFFGKKYSAMLGSTIVFDNQYRNEYEFEMVPDISGNLIFSSEWGNYTKATDKNTRWIGGGGYTESIIKIENAVRNAYLRQQLAGLKIFHFHDTGFSAKIKQPCNTRDYAYLHEDGGNIAAFLYRLKEKHPLKFKLIEGLVRSIAPFFGSFYLQPDEINPEQIFLRWKEAGFDQLFTAHNLSDGTLRMICLATLLLQPELPSVIIIDEPELGLHPFAIGKLAALLQSAAADAQIIVSTQSVTLVNHFTPEDIIVVERGDNHETTFKRQSSEELGTWLENYSLGELWEKNVLGGRPK